MFDISRNRVATLSDNISIVNRTRLLMLTEPTELYNSPNFGVGIKAYIFQYNNDNTVAMLQDRIKSQLSDYEPCVDAMATVFSEGLLFTGSNEITQNFNKLEMSVGLKTIFGDTETVNISDLQEIINRANGE
jgi:phage baseplate assembly protein W